MSEEAKSGEMFASPDPSLVSDAGGTDEGNEPKANDVEPRSEADSDADKGKNDRPEANHNFNKGLTKLSQRLSRKEKEDMERFQQFETQMQDSIQSLMNEIKSLKDAPSKESDEGYDPFAGEQEKETQAPGDDGRVKELEEALSSVRNELKEYREKFDQKASQEAVERQWQQWHQQNPELSIEQGRELWNEAVETVIAENADLNPHTNEQHREMIEKLANKEFVLKVSQSKPEPKKEDDDDDKPKGPSTSIFGAQAQRASDAKKTFKQRSAEIERLLTKGPDS